MLPWMQHPFNDFLISKYPDMTNTIITYKLPLKRRHLKYSGLAFFGALMLVCIQTKAQGDLLLYPKRIVFEGSKRSQTLNLANSGKDTGRYLVSVVQVKMKEDGGFETISQPEPGQRFADKNFRFFPRNVVLAPGEAQSIKIQLVNTNELEPGEYRSHIYFRAEAEKKPLGEKEATNDTGAISVKVVAVFGISIPVIIRVGESTTQVTLTNASLQWSKDTVPSLKVDFNRSGNMSVYGDIAVDHISPEGKITRIGVAKGMALYTPNIVRHFNLLLDNKTGVDYHKGKLYIVYTTQPDAKSIKIAETELLL
jgi:P pilus assembly chaperone PapD